MKDTDQRLVPGTDFCPSCYVNSNGKEYGTPICYMEEERNIEEMIEVWYCDTCKRMWEIPYLYQGIRMLPELLDETK